MIGSVLAIHITDEKSSYSSIPSGIDELTHDASVHQRYCLLARQYSGSRLTDLFDSPMHNKVLAL